MSAWYFLDKLNLDENKTMMMMASTNNQYDLEKLKAACTVQEGNRYVKEIIGDSSRREHGDKDKKKKYLKKKHQRKRGIFALDDEVSTSSDSSDESSEDDDDSESDGEEGDEEVMGDFEKIMKGFARSPVGVYVQSSTLGSLEALLEYLRTHVPPVPVANVGIGPLHRKDVVVASVMLERRKEYATILAFDVKITPEAEAEAEALGVKVFRADIIYHLTDQFSKYLADVTAKKQASVAADAVFPAIVKIIPTSVFNKKDPIVVGVDVLEGKLRMGTPLCVVLPADKVFTAGGLGAEREDDGYVVSLVHDSDGAGRCELFVWDAKEFEHGPFAAIDLGELYPWDVHASWVPGGWLGGS
jgi:translation initiation factor IF-2